MSKLLWLTVILAGIFIHAAIATVVAIRSFDHRNKWWAFPLCVTGVVTCFLSAITSLTAVAYLAGLTP